LKMDAFTITLRHVTKQNVLFWYVWLRTDS
jgi:hypothetical protein